MKKNHLISILSMIIVYIIISILVNKSYILPKIEDIFKALYSIIISKDFLIIVFTTLYRTIIGLILGFVLALILSLLSYFKSSFKEFFKPIYVFLKTIPNITYIIVSLLWLGRNGSVILVSFLVVFPILYNSILNALTQINESIINYTKLINGSIIYKIRRIYLPLIKNDIYSSLNNACSLGFKVSIMAEILSQTRSGIGKELYYAKSNYLMADIFAWTIIIIVISYLIDLLISKLNKLG